MYKDSTTTCVYQTTVCASEVCEWPCGILVSLFMTHLDEITLGTVCPYWQQGGERLEEQTSEGSLIIVVLGPQELFHSSCNF